MAPILQSRPARRPADLAPDAERDNLWAALRWLRDHPDAESDRRLCDLLSVAGRRLASPAVRRALTPLVFELRRLELPAYETLQRQLLERADPAILASAAELYRVVGDRLAELAMIEAQVRVEPDEGTRAEARVRRARLLITLNDPGRAGQSSWRRSVPGRGSATTTSSDST